jgi:molybdopterin/thiamine biosynthesis adenylyltransferase
VNDRRAFFRELASVAREARRATQGAVEESRAAPAEPAAPPAAAPPAAPAPGAAPAPAAPPAPGAPPVPAPAGPTLGDAELERYSRQLVLPEWSEAAQLALRGAAVLIVGAGALGSPVAAYLAAAGVGRLGIVDDDAVELSNLARQPLHFTPDIGVPKAESAAAKLRFLNPEVVVEPYRVRLDPATAPGLVAGQDLVVDCSDSFATRYAVNAACCAAGIPLVEGGVLGTSGLVMAIRPGESACYRCAFPEQPPAGSTPSCAEAGVLGPAAGVIGSLQALEALKLVAGVGTPLLNAFLQLDLADASVLRVAVRRRPECPDCGIGERVAIH